MEKRHMSYEVLARKWRPHNFETMVGQQHVVTALSNALKQQRLHHAYLFTGTRGVGKTTVARILAKCLNCETGITAEPCEQCSTCQEINQGRFLDLIEVDAASRTKVEDTRELLDNVQYSPTKGRYKVYLIDEVHMLSGHSFNALLKTLEEPPAHVKFLLATTDPQKLPATVLSRCLQFHMKNLTIEQIAGHLQYVLEREQLSSEKSALERLGQAATGSMRDALSLLDQAIAYGDGTVSLSAVNSMLGTIDHAKLEPLLTALINTDAENLLVAINHLAENGADFANVLEELLSLLHQITIAQTIPGSELNTYEYKDLAQSIAAQLSAEELQLFYQIALIGRRDLPLAPTPKSGFEMVLLRMLAFKPLAPNSNIETPKIRTSAAQSPANASSVKTVAASTTAPSSPAKPATEWGQIIEGLGLKGPGQAVLSHCTLEKLTDDEIVLQLSPKHAVMLSQNLENRIKESLNNYFKKPMKLVVNKGEMDKKETPAKQQAEVQKQRQDQAEKEIHKDENIKEIINAFNAKIVPDSIETID